ncbi:MAG: glycosyltransferase family 4 protein [Myxococcota bacterium]
MKILFCWMTVSGYMSACWRELSKREGVEPYVIAFASPSGSNTAFSGDDLMRGIEGRLITEEERDDPEHVRSLVQEQAPDVLALSGWSHPSYVSLAYASELDGSRLAMFMDNPRLPGPRQLVTRYAYRSYLERLERVFVTGERCWQLARLLAVPEERIVRGAYGVDVDGLAPLWDQRAALQGGWPRSFLFVGQYTERKGVDVLIRAYRRYRRHVEDPWPLVCCGMGPLADALRDEPGVEDRGFTQPDALNQFRLASGAFVLPSRYDAWPLAIVESCAAGLPVISSNACGSAVELVRPLHNGLVIPTGSEAALAEALARIHRSHADLPEMGRRSSRMAEAYSAQTWADRVIAACEELVASPRRRETRTGSGFGVSVVAKLRSLVGGRSG